MVCNLYLVGRSLPNFALYLILVKLVSKPLSPQDGKKNLISLLHTVEIQVPSFALTIGHPKRLGCSIRCMRKLCLRSEQKKKLFRNFKSD